MSVSDGMVAQDGEASVVWRQFSGPCRTQRGRWRHQECVVGGGRRVGWQGSLGLSTPLSYPASASPGTLRSLLPFMTMPYLTQDGVAFFANSDAFFPKCRIST